MSGKKFESDTREYLRAQGLPAVSPAQSGFVDAGDLQLDPFVIQCKDYTNITDAVREAVDDAAEQGLSTGLIPVGIVKRRRRPIREAYVVMSLETFADVATLIRKEPR